MTTQIEVHTDEHALTPNQDGVEFNVYMDGAKVQCVITGAALKSQFKDPVRPIMDIFTDNQDTIAAMASFLLSTRPERVDGAVIIGQEDAKTFAGR